MLPQGLAFFFAPTAKSIPDQAAAICLVVSQVGLLMFVVLNLRQPGMPILGLGLVLNLLVIIANGGWMPISPEIASHLHPDHPLATWETGIRLGWSKDILLAKSQMHLGWLSDCFLLPVWFPARVAFSPGDILIAVGAFSLLWQGTAGRKGPLQSSQNPSVASRLG